MPARKPIDPNADQSQPPAGAVEDATEVQERTRRTRADKPQQGDKRPAHLRGRVTRVPQIRDATKPAIVLTVNGSFFNPNTGAQFDEPQDWRVRLSGWRAKAAAENLKEGDEIETTGLWLETQESWDGERIDNALQGFEIARPLDASSLVAAPEISGGTAGGVGLG